MRETVFPDVAFGRPQLSNELRCWRRRPIILKGVQRLPSMPLDHKLWHLLSKDVISYRKKNGVVEWEGCIIVRVQTSRS
jgi:hypothetical protein